MRFRLLFLLLITILFLQLPSNAFAAGTSNTATSSEFNNQPTAFSAVWEANDPGLGHTAGRQKGAVWHADQAVDKEGFLNYGPYYI